MKMLMHYNQCVRHQADFAMAFAGCGFETTTNRHEPADIHVIYGPHYCLAQWRRHQRLLYIDRAWWGHDETKPGDGYASIGWLQQDGSRKFAAGDASRSKPDMLNWKEPWPRFKELQCLVLADYGQDCSEIVEQASKRFVQVTIREHPANATPRRITTLQQATSWADVVICTSGSAGFEALIQGVPVICLDPLNPIAPVCADSITAPLFRGDRSEWLHDMAWKQWSLDEIKSGEAWSYLKDVQ